MSATRAVPTDRRQGGRRSTELMNRVVEVRTGAWTEVRAVLAMLREDDHQDATTRRAVCMLRHTEGRMRELSRLNTEYLEALDLELSHIR